MPLVRVRLPDGTEKNVGDEFAASVGLNVLDGESTHNPDGTLRGETRSGGRQIKEKTSVADAAAKKKEKDS